MRAVIQRVSRASVRVDGEVVGEIGSGFLILVGAATGDTEDDADILAGKITALRVFPDADGKMNLGLSDVGGSALVVSQFTLLADVSRGRRPSFTGAADPEMAAPLVERVATGLEGAGLFVARGRFGARMEVESVNEGPVTLVVEVAGGRVL